MAENKGKNTQLGKSLNSVNNHLVRRMTAAGTDGATQPRIQQRQMYTNRKNIAANVERRKQPKFPNPLRLLTLGEVTVILSRAKININYHNKAGHSPLISRCCQHKNPYAALLWQHISIYLYIYIRTYVRRFHNLHNSHTHTTTKLLHSSWSAMQV